MIWIALAYSAAMRVFELILSRKNLQQLEATGEAVRIINDDGMRMIVAIHVVWFVALVFEQLFLGPTFRAPVVQGMAAMLFVAGEAVRVWCIWALGPRWNVRVVVVDGMRLVRRGPYARLKHPNYLAVIVVLFCLPLALGLPYTALLILPLNIAAVWRRIRIENGALERGGV